MTWNIIRILPLLSALTLLAACAGSETAEETTKTTPAKRVETVTVSEVDYQHAIFATGRLSSKEEARLSFKTGGIIKRIYVREGQTVSQGQLLAELDLEEIRAQTRQANLGKDQAGLTIENARLALRLAQRDYENVKGLYQDSVATLEQLQNAEVQLDNARNQLEAARKGLAFNEQNVDVANFNLRYSRIVAPSNGVILKKLAEVNELVGPGTPVFLFGSREKAQVIRVNITDKDIIYVQLDDEAKVHFDAYPQETFRGVVRELASMADPYTGTYEVEVEVFAGNKPLLSGFVGTVDILTKGREALLRIPVDALISANRQQAEVYVVENGRAVRTPVTIYKIQGDQLLVDKGLKTGDEVIVSGGGYLEENDSVMIGKK